MDNDSATNIQDLVRVLDEWDRFKDPLRDAQWSMELWMNSPGHVWPGVDELAFNLMQKADDLANTTQDLRDLLDESLANSLRRIQDPNDPFG